MTEEGGQSFYSLNSAISCGDLDIRVSSDGTWYHEGGPIGRKSMVKLFASVLRRETDGDYWLVTPIERARIQVDDAPFVAVELTVSGKGMEQCLTFKTNIDEEIMADKQHSLEFMHRPSGELAPYINLERGLTALVSRTVYYDLVTLAVEKIKQDEKELGVWSSGCFFSFGESPNIQIYD